MNAFVKEVENDLIAMCVAQAIEYLDPRLQIDDETDSDQHFECLQDAVGVVEQALARLPSTAKRLKAEQLVEAAIGEMLPSISCPPKHSPITDAFSNEQIIRVIEWRRPRLT
jgi:hypothetical protein